MKNIYLDNGATTWPKPRGVADAVLEALRRCGNPSRGSHKFASTAAEYVYGAREELAHLFGGEVERVSFTLNATAALNYAIKGLFHPGCHILIDNLCHNAVRRPVLALVEKFGCTYDIYDATLDEDFLLDDIDHKINDETTIVVATHQCNISSNVLPIEKIGALCKKHGLYFIVDASQSAGHIPINVAKMNISALCMPGHKGLYGPMGVGVLIAGDGVEFNTVIEGGAGISSLDPGMPEHLPDRLEAGTLPVPTIAGLAAGVRFVCDTGVEIIHRHECELSDLLVHELTKLGDVTFYGSTHGSNVSFNIAGYTATDVGDHLSKQGIAVRCGYHCAPIAHRTLGSFKEGSVRVSFSYMNKKSDVKHLINALRSM